MCTTGVVAQEKHASLMRSVNAENYSDSGRNRDFHFPTFDELVLHVILLPSIWDGDQRCAYREENGCEKLLAQEDCVYRLLGEHSHILECYGLVEVHPGVHSLRLERAPYGNVREFIRNNRTTPPSQGDRLRMALGISSGMAHAHAKNVMHCDISCRNLFLFPGWCVKVGDFGSAAVDGDPSRANIVEEIR
jgi:serine/threonine protein kinase